MAGSRNLTLSEAANPGLTGWTPGARVLVTSTSYNPWQMEIARIAAVSSSGEGRVQLQLVETLKWNHTAKLLRWVLVMLAPSAGGAVTAVGISRAQCNVGGDILVNVLIIQENAVVAAIVLLSQLGSLAVTPRLR
jgi:hypothetical protein